MAVETQAFIDEVKANGAATRDRVNAAIAALVPEMGAVAEEIEILARLLAAAEITETNAVVAGKVEEGFQKLQALRRQSGKLEAEGRAVVRTFRDLIQWYNGTDGFKDACVDAGYVV